MAWANSANEGRQIAEDCLFRPTVKGLTKKRLSTVGVGGCHNEIFKGNRNFLGGCKEGGFEHIRMEEERV